MAAPAAATAAKARHLYRELFHMAKNMTGESQRTKSLTELRSSFRDPYSLLTVEQRLKKAEDRMAFIRITIPQTKRRRNHGQGSGTWVYKDGQRLENKEGTLRDEKGKVHTNWDGKNMDPCSVNRHKVGLKRAGFVNNLHAKGIF
eukprot:CAMPEP_0198154006 /NCGR_PEP_ID=MMETSP1443-20131203/66805_1 /TAXON_ID=186043 /ORGANISM="Entomoneis sp., Strain CCMP2396" /LENGTH=144 /DNA_ID=CAMNT_0043820571 /DNA_START=166 /DNA_END=600 /DNA_ORIENTATION=+